ncbi:MAG: universal stress protein [Desulfobacterales bacterium]|nr:universal stress protein [Desulfobacterales bacterium]MDH4009365.1 universal stress protein [Desulfobacterales bacterium]
MKIPVPQWPYLKRPQNKREHLAIKEAPHQFSEDAKQQQEGAGFTTDEIVVERGNPVEEIRKNAEERNCDLIVMGTLADVMLGSTARRVIRRSKIPVLVVRLPEA